MGAYKNVLLLAGLALAQSKPAPVINDNKAGTTYSADLTGGSAGLQGSFVFVADESGQGINYSFKIAGFNTTNSTEFSYHIHQYPVPSNGSCTATGMHFDLYNVTDAHKCDPSLPDTCQIGDLSGKHGIISLTAESANFSNGAFSLNNIHDDFLSVSSNDTAFIGGHSVVVHRKSDSARLACGNIVLLDASNTTSSSTTGANTVSSTATNTATSTRSTSASASASSSSATSGTEPVTGVATSIKTFSQAITLLLCVSVLAVVL